MKKISLVLILVFIFSLFTVGCADDTNNTFDITTTVTKESSSNEEFLNMNNGYTVIVYGKDISSKCYVKEYAEEDFVELSIFPILKEMGGVIEWKSSTEVVITFDENLYNRKYTLNVENHTLYREGGSFDYLLLPPGTNHGRVSYLYGKEYILDSDVFCVLIHELDSYIYVDIEEKTVTITKREGDPIWE